MDTAHWLWPGVRQSFFKDLEAQHRKSGPWDVLFFTGDLTQRGSREEFEKLDATLERLRKHLKELGSTPVLLAVPGNHDLVRPAVDASVLVLRHWKTEPELRRSFFGSSSDLSRRAIAAAFDPYMVTKADSMRGMDRDTSFHLDEEGALSMTFPSTTGRTA
jgi:predicted MPP superfamily phosphohydrolase